MFFRYAAVEKDCNTALALDDSYMKAYLRRGVARRHLGNLSEAIEGHSICCITCIVITLCCVHHVQHYSSQTLSRC